MRLSSPLAKVLEMAGVAGWSDYVMRAMGVPPDVVPMETKCIDAVGAVGSCCRMFAKREVTTVCGNS
jgi:hypothetical protein